MLVTCGGGSATAVREVWSDEPCDARGQGRGQREDFRGHSWPSVLSDLQGSLGSRVWVLAAVPSTRGPHASRDLRPFLPLAVTL